MIRCPQKRPGPQRMHDFPFRDGDITLDAPAEIGFQTDTDTLIATAQAAIQQGVTGLYLPAEVREPVYTADNMHKWGFDNIIAEGTSSVCWFAS